MTLFSIQWMIEAKDENKIIRQFLSEHEISRRALTDIKFSGGRISVNSREENVLYHLKEGDILEVIFPPEKRSDTMVGEDIPLNIVFEDHHILVIDKPAYMNTIPSREHPNGSLANALVGYYEKNKINATVHIVTRLDRNTSGLVLIAKHRYMHHLLSQMQQKRLIHRSYEALAEGEIKPTHGIIEAPIGRKETSIIEREVRSDGQYARTNYEVIRQYQELCHLKIWLDTGRTHQIRVHMSHIGHPLLGDELYGGNVEKFDRQALHCSRLEFQHPLTKVELFFQSEFPFKN